VLINSYYGTLVKPLAVSLLSIDRSPGHRYS
jgi:hypothetical protein